MVRSRPAENRAVEEGAARRTAVLVTGMHRSGTSALARTLSLMGAALPAELVSPDPGNPRGHWEPRGMVDLNDRMLAQAGSDLYSAVDMAPDWFASPAARSFTDEAAQLVTRSFGRDELVVLKDPRTALLAPVWNRALAQCGFRVVHVLPLRHPADVAASLRRRHLASIPYDAWGWPRGEAVWLRYTLAAVRGSRGHARVFLRYGDLLGDWREQVARIGRELDVAWPGFGTAAEAEVDAFLHANDRADGGHAAAEPHPQLAERLDLAALAAALYAHLLAHGDDGARVDAMDADFTRRLGGVGDLVKSFEELYPLVWRFYEESGDLRRRLDLSTAAEARQRDTAGRSWSALTAANRENLRLAQDLGSRDRQVASLDGELARLGDLAAVLEGALAAARAEGAQREADQAALEAAVDQAHRDRADTEARFAALQRSRSWRLTAPLRSLTRLIRRRA